MTSDERTSANDALPSIINSRYHDYSPIISLGNARPTSRDMNGMRALEYDAFAVTYLASLDMRASYGDERAARCNATRAERGLESAVRSRAFEDDADGA